jgi:hypothetical protein
MDTESTLWDTLKRVRRTWDLAPDACGTVPFRALRDAPVSGQGSRRGMSESLRSEQFEALLQQLGPNREEAAACYEQLRRRLMTVFEYRRCYPAEELADETLDRVARKVQEMGSRFDGSDPARYVFGVAWNVARESFRRLAPIPLPDAWDGPSLTSSGGDDDQLEHTCLDRCLERLAASERDLLLSYHQGERGALIRHRSKLAGEQGLSPNALRLKIHRLTGRLRECIARCLDQSEGVRAHGSA